MARWQLPMVPPQASGPSMPPPVRLKLTYFGGPGGRAEPARLALTIAEIPFEDERIDVTPVGHSSISTGCFL